MPENRKSIKISEKNSPSIRNKGIKALTWIENKEQINNNNNNNKGKEKKISLKTEQEKERNKFNIKDTQGVSLSYNGHHK